MTDNAQAFYVEYRPSWWERVWRWLGFRHHHGDDIDDTAEFHGWMQTRSTMHFDLADRLRILFSGRLLVVNTYHLDVPSPDKIHTRMDWEIKALGTRF